MFIENELSEPNAKTNCTVCVTLFSILKLFYKEIFSHLVTKDAFQ